MHLDLDKPAAAGYDRRLEWLEAIQSTINHCYVVVIRTVDIRSMPCRNETQMRLPEATRLLDPPPSKDYSSMTKRAYVLELLLQEADRRKLIRLKDDIYAPRYGGPGGCHFMHSYERVGTIKEFIAECKHLQEMLNQVRFSSLVGRSVTNDMDAGELPEILGHGREVA